MKLAVLIAFVVLAQCLTADAWYVSCWTWNSEVSRSSSDRNYLRSRVSGLDYQDRRNAVYLPLVTSLKNKIDEYSNTIYAEKSRLVTVNRRISDHSSRMAKLDTINQSAYEKEMLFYMILEML